MVFDELVKSVVEELEELGKDFKQESVVKLTTEKLLKLLDGYEQEFLTEHRAGNCNFIESNCNRWKSGLNQLELLVIVSQEAGSNFQEQFLKIKELENDPLLGVLMRLHANALRTTSEIIHLIKGGFADGALARWRTLFELAVTSLIINKHGKNAAVAYIRHGYIKTVEGIEEYQETADRMGLEPYTDEEIKNYKSLKKELSGEELHWHWAREFAGSKKIDKLRQYVGLGHWSHNYKLASRSIHADFYEMRSLLGMQEAKEDLLLVGQSNSGMTLPAHMTALSLNTVTGSFLTAYINKDTELNYKGSTIYLSLLNEYAKRVGEQFLKCDSSN